MSTRVAVLAILTMAACAEDEVPHDPRCPNGWHRDPMTEGGCAPPDGYTALLYAQLGGSGIYGFARLVTPCPAPEGETCGPRMVPELELGLYAVEDADHLDTAIPLVRGKTSSTGVYKLRADPGIYVMGCRDPFDGAFVSGEAEIKADALALFAIDLDHS